MKAKIERGGGFRGILNYGFGKGNACRVIGGNMSGTNPRELALEFGLSRAARPGVKRPVWHASLAIPPGDTLDDDRWAEIAADFMDGMGLGSHQYTVLFHGDRDHEHVHIIASRIGLDGSLYHGKFEAIQAINLTQELEVKHNLTRTKGLHDGPAPKKRPSKGEIEQAVRTGDAPPRVILQEIVDGALSAPGSVFDFMDRIEAAGAVARPNVARTGKMNGFSFEFAGIHFKGSDLGKAYTWKGLTERGVSYDQDRDGAALIARASGTPEKESPEHSRGSAVLDRQHRPYGAGLDEAGGGSSHVQPSGGRVDDSHSTEGHDGNQRLHGQLEGHSAGGEEGYSGHAGGDGSRSPSLEINDLKSRSGGETQSGERRGVAEAAGSPQNHVPVADRGNVGSVRPDDWSPLVHRVAALAAGANPEPLENLSAASLTPAIVAKQEAWNQQHSALGAPQYRLTLMSRVEGLTSFNVGKGRGESGAEKFYTADEVRALIPYLSAHNARGRDIYLTPIDRNHHYLVVDDLTPRSLDDFLAAGYQPALIQESSHGNRQAVMKVPKIEGPDEQKAANAVVVDLNVRFGDQKFSGAIHPFRMAGFSNKKPGRNNAFTRIIEAAGRLCTRTMEQLQAARHRFLGARQSMQPPKSSPMVDRNHAPSAASNDAERAYDRARAQIEAVVTAQGWVRDESRIDYRAAQMMGREGWTEGEVASAILARSPDLAERHRNPMDYAARTAEASRVILEPKLPEGDTDPEGPDQP